MASARTACAVEQLDQPQLAPQEDPLPLNLPPLDLPPQEDQLPLNLQPLDLPPQDLAHQAHRATPAALLAGL